jgi:predicted phosphodiesterase
VKRTTCSFFAALALFSVPLVAWAQHAPFAIVTDSHIGAPNSAYPAFIQAIEQEKITVIIHTGDAIDSPGSELQWKRFLEITGAGKTLHLAPGNHDIHGEDSLRTYLKFFPRTYHSFCDGDTLFILLCTELPGEEVKIAGEQLAWLKVELQKPFRYKFIFLHEPLFPVIPNHGLDRYGELRDHLHRLFVESEVSLVVSGHDHLYDRKTRDGIIYVIAGRAGGWLFLGGPRNGNYAVATRTHGSYSFVVKEMDGMVMDQFSVTREPATILLQEGMKGSQKSIPVRPRG